MMLFFRFKTLFNKYIVKNYLSNSINKIDIINEIIHYFVVNKIKNCLIKFMYQNTNDPIYLFDESDNLIFSEKKRKEIY